ncbi:MAG: NlpC/P60 family protein [Sciscionella sp.]
MATRLLHGVAGRAVLVVLLVAGLAVGGWFVVSQQRDAAATGAGPPPPVRTVDGLPPVAMAAAPANLQTPVQPQTGLSQWAAPIAAKTGIPARALAGYAKAEVWLRRDEPECHLSWVTLAGIGSVASDHGRSNGDHLGADGTEATPLGTVPVQGADGGHSVVQGSGPMQLPDSLWRDYRSPASGGGAADPQNVDDAALTAGRALCAHGRDLATGNGWWEGIRSLRDSDLYLERVLATADLYGTLADSASAVPAAAVEAVRFAIAQLGLPYVWGGNGPGHGQQGFDCSGLTTASYADAGVHLLRTADSQFHSLPAVSGDQQPRLGDLVFYGNPSVFIHHVGIYIGNGQMINAPDFGMAVQVGAVRHAGDDYAGAARPVG